ncbi:hypothetical protein AVEN_77301-1 [Araneus ventricosus]|uniref:Uncharacterized protein n=1 Tax=Araneus ventricosus TaxID=182803 RepID=A0A4Y2R3U9_ARAVE|nr:hypothetical protein AVEN_77301-1 [Araneus ventricosus]
MDYPILGGLYPTAPLPAVQGELKGVVEKTPTRIIGPPTTLINEEIFLPYHPSNEEKPLKPAVLGKTCTRNRLARYERINLTASL